MKNCFQIYHTPQGFDDIVMLGDDDSLVGLYFVNSKVWKMHSDNYEYRMLSVFEETQNWLNTYFSGKIPNFMSKYRLDGATPFRCEVFDIMRTIEYGKVLTYGQIAEIIAQNHSLSKMSAQAVGGAVGWNPLCIIIPCHRVVGANNKVTGYSGGIKNKIALLKLEGVYL